MTPADMDRELADLANAAPEVVHCPAGLSLHAFAALLDACRSHGATYLYPASRTALNIVHDDYECFEPGAQRMRCEEPWAAEVVRFLDGDIDRSGLLAAALTAALGRSFTVN